MKINKLAVFVCCLSVAAIASADLEERVSALENQASLQALENNLFTWWVWRIPSYKKRRKFIW